MSGHLIVVSPEHHRMPVPLIHVLGKHSLIITDSYGNPDAFELAALRVGEVQEGERTTTLILDEEETYNLYQCLHKLFHPAHNEEK
jgi:hypothetical protein